MPLEKRIWLWDFILLALLSAGLRFHHLDALSFRTDEAENALIARAYVENGRFEAPPYASNFNGILYPWITAELFRAFGESEWIARLPAAICGVVATAIVYLWGSHWFGAWTGRWAALLYAVWPDSVEAGRTGISLSLEQLLYLSLIIGVWKFVERNRLGAPFVEAFKTRGPRVSTLGELARVAPCLILVALLIITRIESVLALVFIPLYLLFRLAWSWRRGGVEDAEFERTKNYLYVILGGVAVVAGTLHLLEPQALSVIGKGVFGAAGAAERLETYRDVSSGLFLTGCAVGLVALLGSGPAGWLIVSSVAGPFTVSLFLFSTSLDSLIHTLFPSLCLCAAWPLGWASLQLESFVDGFSVKPKFPKFSQIVGGVVVVAGLCALSDRVFLAEGSVADILAGSPSTPSGAAPDFRGLAEWAKPFSEEALLISADPILSDYYLGRTHYVFPYAHESQSEPRGDSTVQTLPNLEVLRRVLGAQSKVLIVGSREKFDAVRKAHPEADTFLDRLKAESEETWEGDSEVGFVWRRPSEG